MLLDDGDFRSAPPRSRTSSTGFVDRCLRPASQGDESREGIKPSHAVLQTAFLVRESAQKERAGTARRLVGESNPSHPMDSGAATPVASRGKLQAGPKAAPSKMKRGDVRGSNPSPWIHIPPSSQTSNVTMTSIRVAGGLPWSRTTFFRSSGGRYYSTSSQPLAPEPLPGIEPDPPAYGAGARPSSHEGTQAPAEGIEPSSS